MARNAMEEALSEQNEEVGEETTGADARKDLNVICDEPIAEGYTRINVTGDANFACFGYNFGTDLASMTELFGADKVFDAARQHFVVKLQQVTRPLVKKGLSPLSVRDQWKPGVKISTGNLDPEEVAKNFLAGMTKEQLEAMYADILASKA